MAMIQSMAARAGRWQASARARRFSLLSPGEPPYRVLFFGTDDISLATLRCLQADPLVEHVSVVCPSPRKVGRGSRHEPVPVDRFAQQHGMTVTHTPPHLYVSYCCPTVSWQEFPCLTR